MNVLTLIPAQTRLEYAGFTGPQRLARVTGAVGDYRGDRAALAAMHQVLDAVGAGTTGGRLDCVAVRVAFGGAAHAGPVRASDAVLADLRSLAPAAPLHLPAVLHLVAACRSLLPQVPVVLVFETSFFAALPERERLYAVDSGPAGVPGLRRFGYHGVYHEAACAWLARRAVPGRVVSVCLEPCPELAAVLNGRPLTVTAGATPLEGLPGETSCGEIDPFIVTVLARQFAWGPEQINEVLTRRSGLLGLTGRPVRLDEVLATDTPDNRLAAAVLRYRLLLAAGGATAALGGVDHVVFSGRYAAAGTQVGPWLAERLTACLPGRGQPVPWSVYDETLPRLVADAALATLWRNSGERPAQAAA